MAHSGSGANVGTCTLDEGSENLSLKMRQMCQMRQMHGMISTFRRFELILLAVEV